MKNKLSPIAILSIITALLVASLSAGSLFLSFQSVRELAGKYGFTSPGDTILAAIIDGFIIIASVEVLRATLQKERARYAGFLILASTVGSVILNIIYAPRNLLAQILHGIPPITLALSFHLLIGQIENFLKRHATLTGLADIKNAIAAAQAKLADIQNQIADSLAEHERQMKARGVKLTDAENSLALARKSKQEAERQTAAAAAELTDTLRQLAEVEAQGGDTVVWRRDIERRLFDTGMAIPDIAKIMGVSDRTVQRDLATSPDISQPQPVSIISKNGHKAEV